MLSTTVLNAVTLLRSIMLILLVSIATPTVRYVQLTLSVRNARVILRSLM